MINLIHWVAFILGIVMLITIVPFALIGGIRALIGSIKTQRKTNPRTKH